MIIILIVMSLVVLTTCSISMSRVWVGVRIKVTGTMDPLARCVFSFPLLDISEDALEALHVMRVVRHMTGFTAGALLLLLLLVVMLLSPVQHPCLEGMIRMR
jgi:hypothetical protein